MTLPTLTVELGRLTGWVLGESLLGTDTTLAEYEYDDITSRVLSASIRRGRQHELDRIETGTARVSLLNQDGAFNAANTSSPYYPNIRPMVPLRIRATTSEVPETIAGLVAWYDFSDVDTLFQDTARTTPITADGQVIKGVTDKSTSALHLSEATNGPAYKVAIQNGLSVSRHDGTNDQLANASISQAQPDTIFMALRLSAETLQGYFYDGITTRQSLRSPRLDTDANLGWFAGSDIQPTTRFTSGAHISVTQFNGASSKLWKDGGTAVTGNPGSNSLVGLRLAVRTDGTTAPLNGDICEFLVYSGALSLADINTLGDYLGTKWGITWTTAT